MKTTALAMAITDSELSDEEASILESGGFSVSRATTPQLTDLSEGKPVRTAAPDRGAGFLFVNILSYVTFLLLFFFLVVTCKACIHAAAYLILLPAGIQNTVLASSVEVSAASAGLPDHDQAQNISGISVNR